MLVTEGEGLPIGLLIESAQKSEISLAQATLETVKVTRKRGRARTRPDRLTCDRGYDSAAWRRYLARRGIGHCIPMRRRPQGWQARRGRPFKAEAAVYSHRWKVERTFAWLLSNRRVVVRWERKVEVYRGFVLLAAALLCLKRLLQ